ncbi:UNVERIFIED_ORG: hypothetical protein BCL66_10110 [Martelella mediterranea]
MGTAIVAVISKFPEHEFALRRLLGLDPDFEALCEDYAIATEALEVWQHDAARAAQYRNLVAELEKEILQFIERRHPRQSGTR